MFEVEIDRLEIEPLELEVDADPALLDLHDEYFTFEGRLGGRLDFSLVGSDVHGRGELNITASSSCARCLQPVHIDLIVPVREMWLKRNPGSQPYAEPSSEDIMAEYYEGNVIDIREALRKLILGELPDLAFCKPDCKGLCAGCGANLNVEACNCPPDEEPAQPRPGSDWKRALKKLKGD